MLVPVGKGFTRKMLLHENLLFGFKFHLKLQKCVGTTPINFRQQIFETTSKRKTTWQWIKLSISFFFTGILWIQILENKSKEKLVTTLESMLYSSAISTFITFKLMYLKRSVNVKDLLNFILEFERRLITFDKDGKQYHHLGKFGKVLIQFVQFCGFMGTPLLVICYALQRWMIPCSSALFAFDFIPECTNGVLSKWGTWSLIQLTFQITFSLWLITDLLCGFVLQVVEMMYLHACCFKQYIKCLRSCIVPSKFQFSQLLRFRQLQVLLKLYNWIQQDVMIVVLIFMVQFVFVVSLYALIHLQSGQDGISVPQLLFFSCTLLDTFLAIVVCFGTFAGVHKEAKKTLAFMRETLLPNIKEKHREKLADKYVRSFRVLKVNIGKVNFVEKFTPIVMLKICFEQIVNLLLI